MNQTYLPAAAAFIVSLALLVTGCADDAVGPEPEPDPEPDPELSVTAVIVSPEDAVVLMDETADLDAEVQGDGGISQAVTWSSSDEDIATVDAGGQVTPVWPGTATITATSEADPSVSGDATIEVSCRDPELVTSSINEDETWDAQGGGCIDYIVTDAFDVRATLTIEPGTIVAFEQDAGLRLENGGAIIADGTAEAPILLTGTEQQRGWWNGINIRRTEREDNLFNHVTIEYGGQDDPFNQYNPGFALRVGEPAAASGMADSDSRHATITNTTLRQSAGYGLFIRGGAHVTFGSNTLTENALGAARMALQTADVLDDESTFSGNDIDIVMLTHYAEDDVSLVHPGENVRYRIGRPGHDADRARASVQGALTIAPGVVVEFTERSDLTIAETGTLVAEGTDTDPIVFTSLEQQPSFWGGITLDGSTNNSIDHVIVEYGGSESLGNIEVASSGSLTITNSILRNAGLNQFGSGGYGLFVSSSSSVNDDACDVNAFEGNAAGACQIE